MFDEREVQKLNTIYNFKKCTVFYDTIYISSEFDEWIAEHKGNHIKLKHKNKKAQKTRSHHQRNYFDLPYMFNSIKEHDDFVKRKLIHNKIS